MPVEPRRPTLLPQDRDTITAPGPSATPRPLSVLLVEEDLTGRALIEALVGAGYSVYADDHRGHGRTGMRQHGGDSQLGLHRLQ